MGSLLVKALLGALVNPRVVDRLLAILDHAISKRNEAQTAELKMEVQRLHAANVIRFENLEHGLERLGVNVRHNTDRIARLEGAVFKELNEGEDLE